MVAGDVLARGRDGEIIDLGDGLVLRRALDGRSLAAEASVMAHARSHGVPVPRVDSVTAAGEIVMERVSGPVLLSEIVSGACSAATAAATVLHLHTLVNAVPAPEDLASRDLPGDRLLHLDLHVQNIIVTPAGPVLLDWANARRGPAAADLAMSWLIMAAPLSGETEEILALRHAFLTAMRSRIDVASVGAVMDVVTEWRASDRALSSEESAAVRQAGNVFPEILI